MEPYYKRTDAVGLKMSTKSVGSNLRNDITHEYKYKEGKGKTFLDRSELIVWGFAVGTIKTPYVSGFTALYRIISNLKNKGQKEKDSKGKLTKT